MELSEKFTIDSEQRVFMATFDGSEFRHITQKALLDQVTKMISKIVERLVTEFLDVHRTEILRHISVLEIVERIKDKAGDEMVKGLINKGVSNGTK